MVAEKEDVVHIYFALHQDENEESLDDSEDSVIFEKHAIEEAWALFKPFAISTELDNEGHDSYGNLICKFTISTDKIQYLADCIKRNRWIDSDDIIYLGDSFFVSEFHIISHPGISTGIPFFQWGGIIP